MTLRPNIQQRLYGPQGAPTVEGQKLLDDLYNRLEALEGALAAIAAVAGPTGGATTDTEARAAINSIIAAAG